MTRPQLIGRLARDPEAKSTADGQQFVRFSVATDRLTRNGEGETDWHEIVCWGQQAEFAATYLRKGRLVFIAGRLIYRTRTGKDGQQRRSVEIRAGEVLPLDRRPDTPAVESDDVAASIDLYSPDAPF